MRIGKGKSDIAGNRYALAKRWNSPQWLVLSLGTALRNHRKRRQIDPGFDRISGSLDEGFQSRVFACLHQPEMTLRENQLRIGSQAPKNRNTRLRHRSPQHGLMAIAANTIEDDTGNADIRAVNLAVNSSTTREWT